jgi:hypothetical protein
LVVDLDPLHTARGRAALENETAEFLSLQLPDPPAGPGEHAIGQVFAGAGGDQKGVLRVPHQAQRLPGNGKPHLHLGAHRHELYIAAKGVDQKMVELVPAVVADLLSQKTGADTDP